MPLVDVAIEDSIGTLTMNYGKKHNALCAALVDDLIIAFGQLREQRARVAILRAVKGVGVWSAGHDINELPLRRDPLGWDDPLRHLIREIEHFPAPVIALVEGTVWGGGSETVFACDLVVAAPGVTFAVTPARLGVPYNVTGMLTFLNSADIRIVKEMAFTAKPMSAQRAAQLGIINYVVANDEIEAFTMGLARDIAANAPLSISVMKEQLRILAGAQTMSPEKFEQVQGLRRIVYDSHDYEEGITAFKEKRAPKFRGE
ncbi:MAG: methylmalonyl-CoA decarboxylase [Candidatus Velthaea sp.]|jgi:methylmalonyl-CoA decarboxylase